MSNLFKNVFIFAAGAGAGAFVTWKLIETKYKNLAQEEIDSVVESFTKRAKEEKEEEKIVKTEKSANSVIIAAEKYAVPEVETKIEEHKVNSDKMSDSPYVIAPEDFGEEEDYERVSLTYYSDRYLVDDVDEVVDDIENTVGQDSLNEFGVYEDDAVYVRNDRLKCDYEILLDERKYSDVIKTKPRKWED